MIAGVMPDILDACRKVVGITSLSFSLASFDNPLISVKINEAGGPEVLKIEEIYHYYFQFPNNPLQGL